MEEKSETGRFLSLLPLPELYERSFSHRDVVTAVHCSPRKSAIVTLSADGVVKIWHKTFKLFEFAKQLKVHLGAIDQGCFSGNHEQFLTMSSSETIVKVIDLNVFDVQLVIKLDFQPLLMFVTENSVALNSEGTGLVFYSSDGELRFANKEKRFKKMKNRLIGGFCAQKHRMLVALDEKGFIEYIDVETLDFVSIERNKVTFKSKFETDLFTFQKQRLGNPVAIGPSQSNTLFWVLTDASEIWVFRTATARVAMRAHLQSEAVIAQLKSLVLVDKFEVQKKEKLMIDFLDSAKGKGKQKWTADFDESESFVLVPTAFGIAVIDLKTCAVRSLIGAKEKGELFVSASVYQGEKLSSNKGVIGQGGASSQTKEADPLLLSICFKKPKFVVFSQRLPEPDIRRGDLAERDQTVHKTKQQMDSIDRKFASAKDLPTRAVISTTLGDIHIKLFPDLTPRTVENFATHAKNGYYDNTLIHRVVKGYIQGGDPNNDGTGGESIWGGTFADEFTPELKHDHPFTLSMANSGPDTNGSQFFITTLPSPWLDKKHTIFGRAFKGTEVVTEIEGLKTDNFEKPLLDVRIIRISVF